MSAAGRDSPVSRKRPLCPDHTSPAACSGSGGIGGSGSPKVKRRLFAAGSAGSRSTVASGAAAAEVDYLRRRRQLILLARAVASAAVSFIWVMTRRRKYSAQQFARLQGAIVSRWV